MMKQLDILLLLVFISFSLAVVFSECEIPGSCVSFNQLSVSPGSVNQSYNAYSPVSSSRKRLKTLSLEGDAVIVEMLAIRSLAHFDRERIPERVTHAKGTTAFGFFRVTNGVAARYTKATLFNGIGKETRVAVRFSTTSGERGSADTSFGEGRGFAIKFYTEDGIYDQVNNNMPLFSINDPQIFPQMTHAQKRDPRTGLRSANNLWDFYSLRPETLNLVTFHYTDSGMPDGFRHMAGFSIHAFKLTNHKDEHCYAKFVWTPNQGLRNLNLSESLRIAGIDPDYSRRDLFQAIENKNYPSWTLHLQIATIDDIKQFTYNPFDTTKLWPIDRFPLIEVGTLTLNRNVQNAFAENEQIALNPANLVPGISPSPDRLLRGRLFSYPDTQLYRLGVNHLHIPVNREPKNILSERDGAMRTDGNHDGTANYWPNSKFLNRPDLYGIADTPFGFSYEDDVAFLIPDSLEQQHQHARESYCSLTAEQKHQLHHNLAFGLSGVTDSVILNRVFTHLTAIDPLYAEGVRREMIYQGKSTLVY